MEAVNLYLASVSLNLGPKSKGGATPFTANDIVFPLHLFGFNHMYTYAVIFCTSVISSCTPYKITFHFIFFPKDKMSFLLF